MSMEYRFTKLVTPQIIRLLRPQLDMGRGMESTLVPRAEEIEEAEMDVLALNDVSESGWGLDNMLDFPMKFGKIYVGQKFQGFLCLANSSKTYPLTNVKVRLNLEQHKKANLHGGRRMLVDKELDFIAPNDIWGELLTIEVTDRDLYTMVLDVEYYSEDTQQEYEKCTHHEKYLQKTNFYEIDSSKRVKQKYSKKYKFEAQYPFETSEKIHKTENGYYIQFSVTSAIQYPVFIEETRLVPHPDFKLIPNSEEVRSVFDNSQSIKEHEKRSYIFKVQRKTDVTTKDYLEYYKAGMVAIGRVHLSWIGRLGEKNMFYSIPVTLPFQTASQNFDVKLLQKRLPLVVEEPQTISFRITNLTANAIELRLYVNESETRGIAINAISPQEISKVNIFFSFEIQLLIYPKLSGIQRLTGLHGIDLIRNQDINFGSLAEFLVVDELSQISPLLSQFDTLKLTQYFCYLL